MRRQDGEEITELVVPKLGVNFNEVTIIEWEKREKNA